MLYFRSLAWVVVFAGILPALGARADDAPELTIGMAGVKSAAQARDAREQQQGLQLWIDETNARGGLTGRKLKLRYREDATDAETLAAAYEKLIDEDRAELLVGPNAAELSPVAATVAEKRETPMLIPVATTMAFWEHGFKYIFGLCAPPDAFAEPLLRFAKRKDLRRVALVYPDNGFARDVLDGLKLRLVPFGMHVVFESAYPAGQVDFSAVTAKLKRQHPDMIVLGSYLPEALDFMRKAKEQKFSANMMVFTGGAELRDFGQALGSDADGAIGFSQWEPLLNAAPTSEFVRRYKAKFGYEPDVYAAGGYAAGQIWASAVAKAGGTDRARLRKALLELDAVSALGRYKVDARGRQIGKIAYAIQWNRGVRQVILPDEAGSAPVLYPFRGWSKR